MAVSPILQIPLVAPTQSDKTTTLNDMIVDVEGAANDQLVIDLSAGDVTLSTLQYTRFNVFNCESLTASHNLIVPMTISGNPAKRVFAVRNSSSHDVIVGGTSGATVTITAGGGTVVQNDGTDCVGYGAGGPGPAGAAGPAGGAVGISYVFDTTTTNSDPGPGNLRLDHGTQNAATAIFVDILDEGGTDWTAVIDTFDDSTTSPAGTVRVFKRADPTHWIVFHLTAVVTHAGYRELTVSVVGSSASNPFAAADELSLTFDRTGNLGGTNPIAADTFLANTSTISAIPTATAFAMLSAGTGLSYSSGGPFTAVDDGVLRVAAATTSALGGVIVGSGLAVSAGTLSASGGGLTAVDGSGGSGLVVSSGTVSLDLMPGSGIVFNNGTTPARTIDNAGIIGLTDGTLSATGGTTLHIGSGITLGISSGAGTLTAAGSGGSVTSVVAGTGLSGGTITSAGTIALATIAAHDLLANTGTVAAIPTATAMGTLTAGTGLTYSSGGPYTAVTAGTLAVSPATTAALGGVIAGSGITINVGGTISASAGGSGTVTSVVAGTGLSGGTITAAGTLAVTAATTSALGGVIVGPGLLVSSGTLSAAASFRLDTEIGPVGTGADTSEDTLLSYTLPASTLVSTGQAVRITASGGGVLQSSTTRTVRLYFGTTAFCLLSITNNAALEWNLVATIIKSGSNTQIFTGVGMIATSTGASPAQANIGTQTGGQTDTSNIIIKLTGQSTGSLANSITANAMTVELLQ